MDTALSDIGLDHLLGASVAGTDVTDNSVFARLVSASATADWDDFVQTTDSLQAIRDRGDAAWTTGAGGTPPQLLQNTTIATLASQTSFTLTAGSADDDAYNDAIAVITDSATSTQKAVGTISDYTGSTRTVTLAADPGIFTMAVGDTIDIIAALGSAGSAPTAAQVADAVWDEAQADHVAAGSFGETATEIASILADTNELQTDDVPGLIAALNDVSAADVNAQCDTAISDAALATAAALATVDTNVDAILVDTNSLNDTKVPDTISLANINAQVDTALTDIHLDHLLAADYDPASKPGTATALLNELVENDGGVSRFTTNALEQARGTNSAALASVCTEARLAELDAANLPTDVANIETDTQDIQARLPDALVSGNLKSDVLAVSGSTTAADNLEAGAEGLVNSTCAAGSSTTSIATNLTEATDDHYNGRVITFISGAVAGQSTDITDYNGTTKRLTVTALTEAPADTDEFVIS